MINLQRLLILTMTAALTFSILGYLKCEDIIRDKNRVIYDLGQKNNDFENQNSLLKQALLEK